MVIVSVIRKMQPSAGFQSLGFEMPPYRLSGTVYGALLNHRSALAELGDAVNQLPYKAPPRAPVLYLKPRNTLIASGEAVSVPAGVEELQVAASVGVVLGRTACRVAVAEAFSFIAGYIIVSDISIPHDSHFRPAVSAKARDGFCPLGPAVTARGKIANPDALIIRTSVDGVLVQTASTSELIRPVAQLLADVTEFMTLSPGDVLYVGTAAPAPRVRAGQSVSIDISSLGRLVNDFRRAGT
jgi:5-oxopent-3-ene-1,2,5-tricarboxylate decarboxylase / 2-hydroxyhepta-2,4-diene-1,7-dioate isomerase